MKYLLLLAFIIFHNLMVAAQPQNFFFLNQPDEKVQIYKSGEKQYYTYYLKDSFKINRFNYVAIVEFKNDFDTLYYRVGKKFIYRYNQSIKQDEIVMPLHPAVGEKWSDNDNSYEVVSLNSSYFIDTVRYKHLLEIKAIPKSGSIEKSEVIRYYSKGIGIIGGKGSEVFFYLNKIYDNEKPSTVVYTPRLNKAVRFPGGPMKFDEYVQSQLIYSKQAALNKVEGHVHVSFLICSDGKVRDVKVIEGLGYGLDEIAVLIIKGSPDWEPEIFNRKILPVTMKLPVTFILPDKVEEKNKN